MTHSITRVGDWKRLKLLQDELQVAVAAIHGLGKPRRIPIQPVQNLWNDWNHWNEWNFVYGTGPLP
jgi:hypothetical protein